MKNVLIIGSTGQIGSELTMKLRNDIPEGSIVAGFIKGAEPKGELLESGPAEEVDVRDGARIAWIVDRYRIDTIYNLAALLSAVAERKPLAAWDIQMNGLLSILEVAREKGCAVFTPSSIGSFGPLTPHDGTPQDTIQRPLSMYGVTKVATELLSDYYFHKYGVDTRAVRFPGLISYETLPGGGTTDYAVEIFYAAVKGEEFVCPIGAGTFMDMMYMSDALKAATDIMNADPSRLVHRNAFNVTAMSFDPEILYHKIRERIPGFRMRYEVDPVRQAIANSWPDRMDDSCAREEWGWKPSFGLDEMVDDMILKLRLKFGYKM
ncbi:MAG: NAD-dependent epimerase/dehydratase family protein [Bacteroidales bacterium]|nr:NAD-dependent epimerase/dehydratase family protein [Bacteroidales bacterium]